MTGVNNIPGIEEARLGFDSLAFIWCHMLVGDLFLRRSAIFTDEVLVKNKTFAMHGVFHDHDRIRSKVKMPDKN